MNNVVLIGRLTKDPDITYTPSGTAVCKFTLAIGRQGRSDNKPKYEEIDDLPDGYERIDEDIPF